MHICCQPIPFVGLSISVDDKMHVLNFIKQNKTFVLNHVYYILTFVRIILNIDTYWNNYASLSTHLCLCGLLCTKRRRHEHCGISYSERHVNEAERVHDRHWNKAENKRGSVCIRFYPIVSLLFLSRHSINVLHPSMSSWCHRWCTIRCKHMYENIAI